MWYLFLAVSIFCDVHGRRSAWVREGDYSPGKEEDLKLPRYRGATAMPPKMLLPIAVIAVLTALSCDGYEVTSESRASLIFPAEETSEITFVFQADDMPFGFSGAEVRVISPEGLNPQVKTEAEAEVSVTVRAVKDKPFYSIITFRGEDGEDIREFYSLVETPTEETAIFRDLTPGSDLRILHP